MLVSLLVAAAWAAPVDDLLARSLAEAQKTLATEPEKVHYAALAVTDATQIDVVARSGTLARSDEDHRRVLDVDLRVGDAHRDSTHELRGFSSMKGEDRGEVLLPIGDLSDPAVSFAFEHAVMREIDARYRSAAEKIVVVRANQQVKIEEEDPSDDFQPYKAGLVDRIDVPALTFDRAPWETLLVALSKRIEANAVVDQSSVSVTAGRSEKTFVDTEGARLVHGRVTARLAIQLSAVAADGDVISVFHSVDVHDPAKLPDEATLTKWADEAVADLVALRAAPRATPYTGPVLLSGRASAVFFHEVFGHRVEAHRQKRADEGRTFTSYVGKPITAPFIDVVDDPTVARLAGEDLNGFYVYDDEGSRAQRAVLVDDGQFRGFLTQRSPIEGFATSNGHGRRLAGNAPVARMGNTIVTASQALPTAALRAKLVAEAKAAGLPFAIYVDDIEGGFTLTGRVEPNAFNVRASRAYKVFVDGSPDQLVRGIDLVGTPLVAFNQIIAAGDTPEVFNGYCGAESGWVPVSGVAPPLLFKRLEFQVKEKGQDRPPLLPRPSVQRNGAAALEVE